MSGNNAKRSVSIRSRDSQTVTMAVDDSAYATTTKKKRRTPAKSAKRPIYAIKEVPSPAIVAKKAKKVGDWALATMFVPFIRAQTFGGSQLDDILNRQGTGR